MIAPHGVQWRQWKDPTRRYYATFPALSRGEGDCLAQCANIASSNSATMLVILIIGLTAGPAVSL